MRLGTHLQPEFGRVVGEGLRMACYQFVIARRRLRAPLAGLLQSTDIVEDAGKRCRVIGIVEEIVSGRSRTSAASVSPKAASTSARWPSAGA